MKKGLMIMFIAICFVFLAAAFVIADDNSSGNNTPSVISVHNDSNMTFGKCVSEAAKIRQVCYQEDKNISKQCVITAKSGKDKPKAKQCILDYKETKKNCKLDFKEAKKVCIQTYKPKFLEKIRFIFK